MYESELLDEVIELKNIRKFPYFVHKILEIKHALENEEITKGLRMAKLLMEGTCIYILEKHEIEIVRALTYGIIADEFRKLGDEKISRLLLNTYGWLGFVFENGGIQSEDVVYYVEELESLLFYVIKQYPDLIDGLEKGLEKYF